MESAENMPPLKNQYLVIYILNNLVEQVCNCPFIPQNNIGQQPEYPFVTYEIITPEEDTTTDFTNQFDMTVQIDAHHYDTILASNLAQDLRDALKKSGYRRFFTQANIVPHSFTNTSDRTTYPFVNYDQDFGFDCSFLVSGRGDVYQPDQLDFTYSGDIPIESVRSQSNEPGHIDIEVTKDKKKED